MQLVPSAGLRASSDEFSMWVYGGVWWLALVGTCRNLRVYAQVRGYSWRTSKDIATVLPDEKLLLRGLMEKTTICVGEE